MKLKLVFTLSLLGLGLPAFLVLGAGRVNASLVIDNFGNLIYEVEGDVLAQPFEMPPGPERKELEEDLEEADEASKEDEVEDSTTFAPGQQRETPEDRIILRQADPRGRDATPSARSNIIELRHAKDDRVQVKDLGAPRESTSSAELEIEDHWQKNRTKVRSDGVSYKIIRNRIAARTSFPLSVNLDTNELIVTTPAGEKIVTVLPDKAVENMLAGNVLDQIGGKGALNWIESSVESSPSAEEATPASSFESTATGTLTEGEEEAEIELTQTSDGTIAYEIPGIKKKKLFGLFDVTLDRVAIVSAETGELLGTRESLLQRVINLLSLG